MPRVSQEHLDARRQQILDAARRCFVRNGFHATSMQHIFAEAGLSAGAVYRYFTSKDEIIGAIAQTKISAVTDRLDELDPADLPPLDEVFGMLFSAIREANDLEGLARLVGQVWSEAIRAPAVAETLRANVGIVLARLTRVARMYQEAGVLSDDVAPEKVAGALAAIVQGFMLQLTILDVDEDDFRAGVRAILRTAPVASAG